MDLKLMPLAICRTPAFSYEQDLACVWDELKAAIRDSSQHFYKEIAHIEASQLNQLSAKIKFTVWKYYNRSIYRATPFGSFASFTVIPVENKEGCASIQLADEAIRHVFADWSEKEQVLSQQISPLQDVCYLISNSSAYLCNHEIRFISKEGELFSIASIEAIPVIIDSLHYCRDKQSVGSLYGWYQQEQGLSGAEAQELLMQLIELQLLFTDRQPNITGNDYFNRINLPTARQHLPYIISERKFNGSAISHPCLQQLAEAIQFLAEHLPITPQPTLSKFKNDFLKKFEYYEVPLMTALDPEMGVGYGGLENYPAEDPFGFDLKKMTDIPSSVSSLNYSGLHQFLLRQLIMHSSSICLEDYSGKAPDQPKYSLPNTLSAIVRFYGDQLVMEEAGGSTATSLLGRFTLANAALEQFSKELAAYEATANPEVLFFDIAYQGESHADNINRRKSIYPYELNIHSWCGDALPLALNDLVVSVQQGNVILRSVKYGKRVVPRLTTAYNYSRADLSVYRFLCDLQHQQLTTNLNLDPAHIFPGLDHYPRIHYKDVILSPAKWQLPTGLNVAQLREWLEKNAIRQFKYGHADQTLCFRSHQASDLEAFLELSKNHPDGYISEAFLTDRPAVTNENGQPKLAEFVLHFHHTQTIYPAASGMLALYTQLQQKQEAWCLPGGKWLYFEIYGHPNRSNELLIHQIAPFIQLQQHRLENWFFIRYDQPGPHIRLRLQLKRQEDGYPMMEALSRCLEPALREGTISDLLIKPYIRETERYHAAPIHDTEVLFSLDSVYALQLVQQCPPTHCLYSEALLLMELVLDGSAMSLSQQLAHISTIIAHFNRELAADVRLFKQINQSYQVFKRQQKAEHSFRVLAPSARQLAKNYLSLLNQCPGISKLAFMADLFHMHINRLFSSEQLSHEQLMYHFLYATLKEKVHLRCLPSVSKDSFHNKGLHDLVQM